MPKRIIPLTDIKVQKAKPKEKPFSLFDGGGLYLLITPSGGKLWRFKYRFDNKEKKLAFGSYPEIRLLDARRKRDDARRLLANNVDPDAVRKAQKQANIEEAETFEVIAREWQDKFKSKWLEGYSEKIMRRLELNVFPWMGSRPIKDIKAPELLSVLRRIESRGALELAHRTRNVCGQIFRYAVATGRSERNPAEDLKGALSPVKTTHRAAIIEPKDVGKLLRSIDSYQGSFTVQCALKFAPLVFVRPGELRHAEWSEINLENAEWNIPGSKMKMKEPHLVPLSKQAIAILTELKDFTGSSRYVFPSERTFDRPMSNNTILAALRNLGYTKEEMTPHGFRAMARTILDEVLQVRPDFIEHQLAHAVRDPNGRAYNRTSHLEERRKMMQQWADYLDELKQGAKVLPFRKNK
ncbi:MAG TPA: integrase arm-type DNA-binding domain-containing protein [Smithellaceae bacterium]|nr:integrase arm-type DNA-binding domain-containing protein [Smithellaceae bacterium]